jgi:hypothetical protein
MSNLRSRDAYRDAAWDWEFLNGCFGGTRIRPTDIDGMVERHGHFLFLEMKPPNGHLSKGQEIALEQLSCLPRHLVLIAWGDQETCRIDRVCVMVDGYSVDFPCTTERFQRIVRDWYKTADKDRS